MKSNQTGKKNITRFERRVMFAMFSLLVSLFTAVQTKAQSVDIIFNPSTSNVALNQVFNVDVRVDFNSGTINALDVYVNFNPAYLEVVSVSVPAGTQAILPSVSTNFMPINDMNTLGRVDHGRFTTSPTGHPNADFTLFTIQFRAIGNPPGNTTPLTFNTSGVRLTDAVEGLSPALNQVVNGQVNFAAACTTPAVVIGSSCSAGSYNLILQSSSAGTAPFDLVINGTTYNNVNVGGTIATFNPVTNIFGSADPGSNDETDAPVTLGIKFRSTVAGTVRGVRFFAPASPTGTYTGMLYDNAGVELASAVFTSVTGEAWNEVSFPAAVNITANTTYVIAYHTSTGRYTSSPGFFAFDGEVNGPLEALENSVDGPNGVYSYGAAPGFSPGPFSFANYPQGGAPDGTFGSGNYWPDVMFVPSSVTYELTSVTDDGGCNATGTPLQSLVVNPTSCGTLPVSFLSLSASPSGKNITVKWATATEENNKGFEVLRSLNGQNGWQSIGFVNGAGNSSSVKNYSYIDNNLAARRYFYQLKQIDIDNRFKYSAVVSAMIDGKEGFILEQNFPNPVTTKGAWIRYSLPRRTNITLAVFDMNGKQIRVLDKGIKDQGTHSVPFEIGSLTRGIYYYKIIAEEFTDVKKLVIQ